MKVGRSCPQTLPSEVLNVMDFSGECVSAFLIALKLEE
jgi:hypothetical protein